MSIASEFYIVRDGGATGGKMSTNVRLPDSMDIHWHDGGLPGGKMSEHTPTPWVADWGTVPPDGPGTYCDIYVDGGDTIIARVNDCIESGHANAAFIVEAVNGYADMQASLVNAQNAEAGAKLLCEEYAAKITAMEGQVETARKDAFYAGYWAWFGPASQEELERGCSELDKSWAEYDTTQTPIR